MSPPSAHPQSGNPDGFSRREEVNPREPAVAREPRLTTDDGQLTPYGESTAEDHHTHQWDPADEWPADMDPPPFPDGSII